MAVSSPLAWRAPLSAALPFLGWLLLAAPAPACYPPQLPFPFARSNSRVCLAGSCLDAYSDYMDPTRPAVSQRSTSFAYTGVSLAANSALAIDNGYFSGDVYSGGYSEIQLYSTIGAGASVSGELHECFTVTGSSGTGRLHLPLHLTGGILVSWTIAGEYQLNPVHHPQMVDVRIICAQAGALSDCNDPFYRFFESHDLDEELELVLDFAFDQTFYLVVESQLALSYGVPANGEQTGLLTGMVEGSVLGQYGAAYVTDTQGTPVPNAVITSASGYDYTNPVPEPAPAAAGATAGLALAAARLLSDRTGRSRSSRRR
jgi:hypothetical protein